MKFLLDQGLPRSLADLLRTAGLDALHVGECQLSEAADALILDFARRENRIVVTNDADFHTLMALANESQPSVIRIRIEGLKAPALFSLIQLVLDACQEDLDRGALVSVNEDRIRLRSLPIK